MAENDYDNIPSPPSTLDLDRRASAACTGREHFHYTRRQHTDASPTISGGDVDADWNASSNIGDEAPGGDSPTPDQNVTDEIGAAIGLQYQDNEELRGTDKIDDRDRRRWELDPASSEDYKER